MQAEGDKYTCTLDIKRPCPFRLEDMVCSNTDAMCGFMQKGEAEVQKEEMGPYVRKPRWYEQYYNGTKNQGLDIIKRN